MSASMNYRGRPIDPGIAAIVNKALKHNADFDAIDKAHGIPILAEMGDVQMRQTVLAAMEAGLIDRNWNCIAQAFAMLVSWDAAQRDRTV